MFKPRFSPVLALLLAVFLLPARPALAEDKVELKAAGGVKLITANDLDAILNLAKGYGSASLTKDNEGDPKIQGKIDGLNYGIYFFDCKQGASCGSILFNIGWTQEVKKVSLEETNAWNQRKRYAHAFLDKDGDVALQMDVMMKPGMTEENLDMYFQLWNQIIMEFQRDALKK